MNQLVVTKREIMVSVIIFFALLGIGYLIDNFIIEQKIIEIEKYNKALKINNDKNLFKYGIDTEIGNALVYGKFNVDQGVSYDELKGNYIYIKKRTEEYRRHSRNVCHTCGKTRCCHTEIYYSWDIIKTESKNVEHVDFLNQEYEYHKFCKYPEYRLNLSSDVIDTWKDYISNNYLYKNKRILGHHAGDIRYLYYYTPKEFMGTVFIKAKNKTILNTNGKDFNCISINNSDLKTTIKNKKESGKIASVIFWTIWLSIIGLSIYGFVALENDYLED